MQAALFTLVDRGQLAELLDTFHACTGLPVRVLDAHGDTLENRGADNGYCRLLARHVFAGGACQRVYQRAMRQAQAIGEPYIFSCDASLNHILFPLSDKGALLGAIAVGPFLMDAPDSTLVSALPAGAALAPATLLELYDALSGIAVLPPARARHISRLIFYLFAPLIPGERQRHLINQGKLYQQARISESIQRVKEQGITEHGGSVYAHERELLDKVRLGDLPAAKGTLNTLLGYVFFSEGGKMAPMRHRAMELCTLLSRVAIESGALPERALSLSDQFLSALQATDDADALCLTMQEIVEAFVDTAFSASAQGEPSAARQAMRYIAQHYAGQVTLTDVAAHVGLSPAYFSGLFRRATGVSFKDYLTHVRIEESKRLLSSTDMGIVDIAMAMGFSDQSYFSKVFRRHTGLSPKQYR